jgi:hypothetical protein
VDETSQPKVLDFGVPHALEKDLLTSTGHTRTGQLVGTLSYMSPEQAAADPAGLDQRSDIYTLGVILFELLAGRLPYPLERLPLPEVARVIRKQEPSRLGSLDTRFRGDVETIVAKTLEKDRARRYQSATELAADIRRHLRNEPIRARPPSALYQLAKFARRPKALVGGAAGVMTVCQWDAGTGEEVERPYEGHVGEVWTAVYSPDGRWVILANGCFLLQRAPAISGRVTVPAAGAAGGRLRCVEDDDGRPLLAARCRLGHRHPETNHQERDHDGRDGPLKSAASCGPPNAHATTVNAGGHPFASYNRCW